MEPCPKCEFYKSVKNGKHLGRQRYRCSRCGFQFTTAVPRGVPAREKVLACLLYSMGVPLTLIAEITGVSPPAVSRWVQKLDKKDYGKPLGRKASIVHLGEMWQYLHAKNTHPEPGTLVIAVPVSALRETVGLVLGEGSRVYRARGQERISGDIA